MLICRRADKLEGEWGEVDHAFALKSMATRAMVATAMAVAFGIAAAAPMKMTMANDDDDDDGMLSN